MVTLGDLWWPDLWPDLVWSVTSNSNICTWQLTPYRWFWTKCVLLGVIALSLEAPWTVKHFIFDLTCDVIGDPEVNEIWFPLTNLTGLSNAVWIFRIRPVVSEIRGGQKSAPPPSRGRWLVGPPPAGLNQFLRRQTPPRMGDLSDFFLSTFFYLLKAFPILTLPPSSF